MKAHGVQQDNEEVDEEVNGDYICATEDEEDGESAPVGANA